MLVQNQPSIDVIIPTYNTPESLLRRCLDSICHQTYTNFCVYLIDDGSDESHAAICDTLAEQDNRIHVQHQKNAGVSAARNSGIRQADGTYLTFVDADDELLPNAWEIMISYMEKYHCDCGVMGWYDYTETQIYEHRPALEPQQISFTEYQSEIASDNFSYGGGYPWNKIWRRSSLLQAHNCVPLFNEKLDRYEDKLWALQASQGLEHILLVPDLLYRYHFQPSSLSFNLDTLFTRTNHAYEAYDIILDYLQPRNLDAYRKGANFYFTFCRNDLAYLKAKELQHTQQYKQSLHALHRICKRIAPRTLYHPICSKEFLIWAFLHFLPCR